MILSRAFILDEMINSCFGIDANKGYGRGDDADNDGYDDGNDYDVPNGLPPHTRPSDMESLVDTALELISLMNTVL